MLFYLAIQKSKCIANFSAFCRTRVTIEQAFGQIKRRFHCLHAELRVTPEKVCAIFIACAVLHNISKDLNIPEVDDDDGDDTDEEGWEGEYQGHDVRDRAVRDFITAEYFE